MSSPFCNIQDVVNDGACHGCGVCAGICSTNAIFMDGSSPYEGYFPKVNSEKCIGCSNCLEVCPAINWTNSPILGDNNGLMQYAYDTGSWYKVYAACSSETQARYDSASGGFTTTLLVALLESGRITGAIVTRRCKDDPLKSEVVIVKTSAEIRESRGSVYSPTHFGDVLQQLMRIEASERLAVVGLPCHLQGIELAVKCIPRLNSLFKYKISLVCGHAPLGAGYYFSMGKLGIKYDQVLEIRNRGDGWPGYLRFVMNDGRIIKVPHGSPFSWGLALSSPLFTPRGCHVCPDATGFQADISTCDAWLPRFRQKDNHGMNLVLTRNLELDDFINTQANESGVFVLTNMSIDDLRRSAKSVIHRKMVSRPLGEKILLRSARKYHANVLDNPIKGYKIHLLSVIYYVNIRLANVLGINKWVKVFGKPLLYYFKIMKYLNER